MSDNVYRQQLEKLGEDLVRHRVANRMAIGDRPENNPPYEFVHIWLGAKVAKRRRAENWRYGVVLDRSRHISDSCGDRSPAASLTA